jgi:hypothetical protein
MAIFHCVKAIKEEFCGRCDDKKKLGMKNVKLKLKLGRF